MKNIYILVFAILYNPIYLFSQTPTDLSVQLTVVTQQTPPQIKLVWRYIPPVSSYAIYRKDKSATSFGTPIASIPGTDTVYTDTNVSTDSVYEYQVIGASGSTGATGYIYASIKAPAIHNRGTLLLLVDSTFSDSCKSEINQLMKDLRGDGWKVSPKTFLRTESVSNIKTHITNAYNTNNTIKSVFIVGHLAVPYSGNLNPDAHPDHQGAWPADVFYGDVDGKWTDATVSNTIATGTRNDNTPGDGKYDQSVLPSDAELQVGRIDFFNMPAFGKTEIQMMRNYLNRAHSYKMDSLTILRRGLVDDNFGMSTGEPFAANGWRNFSPFVYAHGTQPIDYITSLNTATYQWSYGCGGGSYTSAGGVGNTTDIAANNINGIFTMLFGSYFGDWDNQNNFLRAPLCANIPALTNCWAGRPHWFLHHMALGENIGYSTLLSQNNSALYLATSNYGTRMIHIALMGDPSLRSDYMKPVKNVALYAVKEGAKITWASSPDPAVIGYYVYSSNEEFGTYTKRSDLVNVTNFIDETGTDGLQYYMVRAVKVQTTPSGSYHNLSLGVVSAPVNIDYPNIGLNLPVVSTDDKIKLHPNPGTDKLKIEIKSDDISICHITITDNIGRVVIEKERKLQVGNNNIELNTSQLESGFYFITTSTKDKHVTNKWIKK